MSGFAYGGKPILRNSSARLHLDVGVVRAIESQSRGADPGLRNVAGTSERFVVGQYCM
jgi:hypothetical protein